MKEPQTLQVFQTHKSYAAKRLQVFAVADKFHKNLSAFAALIREAKQNLIVFEVETPLLKRYKVCQHTKAMLHPLTGFCCRGKIPQKPISVCSRGTQPGKT